MEIKRYDLEMDRFCYDCKIDEYEDPNGKWVRYEDHAKLVRDFEQAMKAMDQEILSLQALLREALSGNSK